MLLTTSLLQSANGRLRDLVAEADNQETRILRFTPPSATSIEHRSSAAELFEHLQAKVSLHCGKNNSHGDAQVKIRKIKVLPQERHWTVCTISLLFVLGLRCQLFTGGNTVEDVSRHVQVNSE